MDFFFCPPSSPLTSKKSPFWKNKNSKINLGDDFYTPYEAQDMARRVAPELGMDTVPSLNITYTEEKGYVTADVAEKENLHQLKLSGTKFRQLLRSGEEIPEWFAFKSVVKVLRET